MLVRAMTRVRTLDRRRSDDDDHSQIWEFSRQFDRVRLEIAARLDLGLTDLQALHVVHNQPRCTPGELARALDLTVSGTSGVIDRLTTRLLIERRRHPIDRRSLQLELMTSGRHAVRWSTDEIVERITGVLQMFEPEVSDHAVVLAAHAAPRRADGLEVPPASTRVDRPGAGLPATHTAPRRTGSAS